MLLLYKYYNALWETIKGTSYDFTFQILLFSTLADIFAYLETPPMYYLIY